MEISGLEIVNVTDLAVYFAGCENVDVYGLKMRVYIDGVSPDNSKNVRIYDCDIEEYIIKVYAMGAYANCSENYLETDFVV